MRNTRADSAGEKRGPPPQECKGKRKQYPEWGYGGIDIHWTLYSTVYFRLLFLVPLIPVIIT